MDFSKKIETIQLLRKWIVSFSQSKLKKNNKYKILTNQRAAVQQVFRKMASEILIFKLFF